MARTLALLGTGTGVGKTYVAERLLRACAARGIRAYGYKPVESGFDPASAQESDIARLARASCHVKHSPVPVVLRAPVAPYLAARLEGADLDPSTWLTTARDLATTVDLLLLELPGGAFSPVTEAHLGVDLARSLGASSRLLVAPDRLGVLHDLGATLRACALAGAPIAGIALTAPESPDASTSTNAAEIPRVTSVPLFARFPRLLADAPLLPGDPAFALLDRLLS